MNVIDRIRYAPFLTQLVVTRRCNLTCGYCNEYDRTSDPVPYEVLTERIDHVARLGSLALELTGGEPLLHPRIADLVRHARRRRFAKVMMISNAYRMTEAHVKALNDAGLQSLQVSVDGVEPNETTVKVLRPLRRKLEVLARHARFEVVLSAVLGAAPPEEALEVVRFAREHGFVPRVLVLHDGQGQMQLSPSERQALTAIRQSLGRRFSEAHDYRTRILEQGAAPFRCRAGSRYLYVDEHGTVHWCSQTMSAFGEPLERYDLDTLRRQFETPKPCNTTCTLGCSRSTSRLDEWRRQDGARKSTFAEGL